MGITRCERHGDGPFIEVCEHVRAQVEAGKTPVGHRLNAVTRLMVCERCFRIGGFDKMPRLLEPSDASSDEYYQWVDTMLGAVDMPYATLENRTGYCLQCFEALGPKDLSEAVG